MNKPIGVVTASPNFAGGIKGQEVLCYLLTVLSTKLIQEAILRVPYAQHKINDKGKITDESLKESLQEVMSALIKAI